MLNTYQSEILESEAIDVAEAMLESENTEKFQEMLDNQFDLKLGDHDAESLLSRCHSAVTEEIYKYVRENKERR